MENKAWNLQTKLQGAFGFVSVLGHTFLSLTNSAKMTAAHISNTIEMTIQRVT